MDWNREKRKEHFMLFSRSGFADSMTKAASKEGVILFRGEAVL